MPVHRIIFPLLLTLLTLTGCTDRSFVSIAPEPTNYAWWLRAEFNPFHDAIRGIPVGKISKAWCKATEFTSDLFPRELLFENGKDSLAASGVAFAVEGHFDYSKNVLQAMVGVYQTCGGEKGTFLLVIEPRQQASAEIRFLEEFPSTRQFAALRLLPDSSIELWWCLECDDSQQLKWSKPDRSFIWVPTDDDN